jgi:glycosyltransferase involved in cell wall biosynthesis
LKENYPFVTAMIVVRNEERYIGKCFQSFLEQNYPKDRYEVLIIDGCSTDHTMDIVRKTYEQFGNGVQVRYLENPKLLLASGWNLGIKSAKGDYVCRIDAHGYADQDFIRNSVETILAVPDAVCVGGSMKTQAISAKGQLIANVLSSPFGVGNSKFRYSQKAEYVDTVAFGLYRKEIFEQVGYFDETLRRNQDNDMHRRIREAGGKFYLNPAISSVYYSRDSIKGMMRQGYLNGYWNIITFRKDPASLSVRHLVPLAFVCGILGCIILGIFWHLFWWILCGVVLLHLLSGVYFAFRKTRRFLDILVMPFLFLGLHISYGTGSFLSILRLPFHNKK